jgi:hypothetical protein
MRPMLAAGVLAYGLIGMAELALATVYAPGRIYVPGHIRDGVYIRPHFVSTPQPKYGVWPAERPIIAPDIEGPPPLLGPPPAPDPGKLGEPS